MVSSTNSDNSDAPPMNWGGIKFLGGQLIDLSALKAGGSFSQETVDTMKVTIAAMTDAIPFLEMEANKAQVKIDWPDEHLKDLRVRILDAISDLHDKRIVEYQFDLDGTHAYMKKDSKYCMRADLEKRMLQRGMDAERYTSVCGELWREDILGMTDLCVWIVRSEP